MMVSAPIVDTKTMDFLQDLIAVLADPGRSLAAISKLRTAQAAADASIKEANDLAVSQDTAFSERESAIAARDAALTARENAIATKEGQIAARETAVIGRETDAIERESRLDAQQAEIDTKLQRYDDAMRSIRHL